MPSRILITTALICQIAGALMLLCVPARALDPQKDVARYGRQSWQTEGGLPQNTIHAILQNHEGYVWLATEGGLVRFDGMQFVVYDMQTTSILRTNNIRSLLEDRSGTLWVGTADGLLRYQNSRFTVYTQQEGLPGNNVWSVYEDRTGRLWILTADGLARYDEGKFQVFTTADGLSSNNIVAVTDDEHGGLWIATDSGVDHLTGRKFKRVFSAVVNALQQDPGGKLWVGTKEGLKVVGDGQAAPVPAAGQASIDSLFVDRSHRLWLGTANGLLLYRNGRIQKFAAQQGLPGSRIGTIFEDKQGAVWVSTNLGIARFLNDKFQDFTQKDGLSGSSVLSMFEDREGSLWLGTEAGGLTVLRDQKFTTYASKEGLSDDLVRCVFQDRAGTLWAGTNGGGLSRFNQENFENINTGHGLSSNVVLALADDPDGGLLVGTPDGLNRIRNGQVSVLTSADGLADDFIRSLYRDIDGSIWIGTRRGLSHWQHHKFTTFTQADGLASDFVGTVLRDSRRNLWIGTLKGLNRLNGSTFQTFTTEQGLSSDVITSLHEDGDGVLWIGSSGGGLNRYLDGKIFAFPRRLGLPDVIYAILDDGDKHLWLSSNKGVFRANKKDLNAFAASETNDVEIASYGTADGMGISECSGGGHPAAWRARDGSLWFSTLKGVTTIHPQRAKFNSISPPVALESVSIDDQVVALDRSAVVTPGHSRLAFQYAGLSFIAPQKVHFKYKLEGFDHAWIDAGARRAAYYTNVPPGQYTFKALASNNDGVWGESGINFAVDVRPHFYQTYWFYVGCVAAALFAAYETYLWRLKRVESRFQVVLQERNRIAREIHDTLAQSLVAISVQLEVVTRMLSISAESARDHLNQARQQVQNSIEEARHSIWDLRFQSADNNDLAARLSKIANQLTKATPVKVQVQVGGTYRPLPARVEDELLRIGQEAITNVVRHSAAEHVHIKLKFDVKKLQMTIQDDGRGFAVSDSGGLDGHYGLKGMHERADQIRGQLRVKSAPGEGTLISVEAPIG